MSVPSSFRRATATAVAALLAVGVVPLFASQADAGITGVSPTIASNANGAFEITVDGDGSPPFDPLLDTIVLRRNGTTETLPACTTVRTRPTGPAGTPVQVSTTTKLVATCDLQAAAPAAYDVIVNRPPDDIDTEPTDTEAGEIPAPDEVRLAALNIFGAQPTVTSFTPATKARGTQTATDGATVKGTNLSRGTRVEFLVNNVVDSGVTFANGTPAANMTSLPGTLTVTASALLGAHDLRVTTADGAVASLPNAFSVTPAPAVTELSPPSVGQNADKQLVTITGSGFQPNVTVTIPTGADNVTIGAVGYVSPTAITAQISATSGATTGSRTLVITNPDGGTTNAALAITGAPTITAVPAPASRGQNSAPQNIQLTGTGFVTTAERQTQFSLDPATGVTINSVTVSSPTSATLNITVAPSAPVGKRTIVTRNFDGGNARSSEANSLSITAGPTVTSVSPGSRTRGSTGNVTVNGTNFPTTGTAPSVSFGPGVTVNGTTLGTATSFTANITVDGLAEQGPRNVVVTNPDGGVGSCVCFSVDALSVGVPTPSGVVNGSPRTITIPGGGFSTTGAPTVLLVPAGAPAYQPTITGTNVTVSPAGNALTATFDFTYAAPLAYTVRVTNPNGDTGSCSHCFTVISNPPAVTSISPASKVQGAQDQLVTINGSNFSNGVSVAFERAGITVDAGSVTLVSPTQLTAVIDVAPGTATTPGDVTVTLPSGQFGTCDNCFTATAAPTLTGANPAGLAQGASRLVTFTGTGFVSGATLTFGNQGVTVAGTPTVVNATTMTATVNVAGDATPGPVSVTVTNTDGGTGTCASTCFAVNDKPTISSVNPSSGGVGKSVNVQLIGTNFPAGVPAVTAGEGVVVTNPARASSTLITATFTIAANAAKGARTINLTTTDGGSAVCASCFTVVSSPSIASVTPDKGTQGSTIEVVVGGVEFSGDPKPDLSFGPDITVKSIGESTATGVVATIEIARTAATGARSVSVTNPDGGTTTCSPACFTVVAGPSITAATPSSAARGRNGVPLTIDGEGFAADSTVSFGDGVTVVPETTQVTVNATAADQIAVTVNIAPDATPGARTITVTNPSDGNASGVCTTCFSVAPGRAMVVELFDTRGTASTADDVLTDKPVSGTAYRVRVTAKNGETAAAPTDTAFTGPVALSNLPVDTTFAPGTCSAAVAGVASCSNVVFGDLGSRTLAAQGSGDDSDRRGTLGIVTQATGLQFTAAPASGSMNDVLTYTVRPTAAGGASIAGYNATRILTLTGTGANRSNGPLSCDSATCSFSVAWSTQGVKSVKVTDNGVPPRSTPTVNVTIASVGLFKPLSPARILDTRKSTDSDGFSSPIGSNATINVQATGRGGVPTTDVSAVVVNVTVDRPTASGYLSVFPSGGVRPLTSTLNFGRGDILANLAVVKVGTGGKISIYNMNGNTSTILDVVGYYTASTTGAGGRLVAVEPERIFDTAFGSPIGPDKSVTANVTDRGGVPAQGVDSVILAVSAMNPTGNGYLTVYPGNLASRPTASTLNFRAGNNVGNLVYAKVSELGQVKVYNSSGSTRVALDVMGYVMKTGTEDLGRFVALTPARVIDTRGGSNSPIVGKIGPGGVIDAKLVNVGGVPATGVSAVVVNLTATQGTARSFLRAYPTGIAAPNTANVHFNANQNFANLVVVKVGDDGKVRIRNNSGSVHAIVDVVGYLTS